MSINQNISKISSLYKTATIGRELIHLDSTSSTNDIVWEKAKAGAPEGLVIIADSQTSGRGRLGHEWHSPEGGIWLSTLLRPAIPVEHFPLITAFAALAVCELLRNNFSLPAMIRWPNDIVINHKKISGILAESRKIEGNSPTIVLGMGINVNIPEDRLPADIRTIATSIQILTAQDTDIAQTIAALIQYLDTWYAKVMDAPSHLQSIHDTWVSWAETMNTRLRLKYSDEEVEGNVTDLHPIDGITLRLPSGLERTFPAAQTTVTAHDL